jgi:hypothetical protein
VFWFLSPRWVILSRPSRLYRPSCARVSRSSLYTSSRNSKGRSPKAPRGERECDRVTIGMVSKGSENRERNMRCRQERGVLFVGRRREKGAEQSKQYSIHSGMSLLPCNQVLPIICSSSRRSREAIAACVYQSSLYGSLREATFLTSPRGAVSLEA